MNTPSTIRLCHICNKRHGNNCPKSQKTIISNGLNTLKIGQATHITKYMYNKRAYYYAIASSVLRIKIVIRKLKNKYWIIRVS